MNRIKTITHQVCCHLYLYDARLIRSQALRLPRPLWSGRQIYQLLFYFRWYSISHLLEKEVSPILHQNDKFGRSIATWKSIKQVFGDRKLNQHWVAAVLMAGYEVVFYWPRHIPLQVNTGLVCFHITQRYLIVAIEFDYKLYKLHLRLKLRWNCYKSL